MDELPNSTCDCCQDFATEARSWIAVVCLVCEEPCNLASCVERNRLDAESVREGLIERPARDLWMPEPRARSELPRSDAAEGAHGGTLRRGNVDLP